MIIKIKVFIGRMNEKMMRKCLINKIMPLFVGFVSACLIFSGSLLAADGAGRDGVYQEDGRFFDKDDNPTWNYTLKKDKRTGKEVKVWDWPTYVGNRKYHSDCHVCHGPLGLGGTFAPALAESLKTLSYEDFRDTVVNGRTVPQPGGTPNVMPSFGPNKNVMCYLDDIYVYLKARSDGSLGPIATQSMKREPKSAEIKSEEYGCMGWDE